MRARRPGSAQTHLRFGLYGLLAGLLLGAAAGVWLSSAAALPLLVGRGVMPFTRPAPGDRRARDPLEPFNLQGLTVDRQEIVHGGPRKDGIPSLTEPATAPARAAGFLGEDDRVVGVTVSGESRAYPIRLLAYHEVVNDLLGGVPIAVVYCPLCDSVSVVDRRLDATTLTFGVSGLLRNSNVLMFDREHEALWSQLGFTAISGPFAGRSLGHLPWAIERFGRWSRDHPESTVVRFPDEYRREYDRDPYGEYRRTDELFFPVAVSDRRLRRKEPVVGIRLGDVARAYSLEAIRSARDGRLVDRIGDRPLVLEATADGGVAVVAAPAEARVVHAFWFAWAAFHPATELLTPAAPPAGNVPGAPALAVSEASGGESGPTFDHGAFDRILRTYVAEGGWVDYAALDRRDREGLRAYVASLAGADLEALPPDEALALLINSYNAFTIELILEHWEGGSLRSIRDIPAERRWEAVRWRVGRHVLSLDQLEHELIRPRYGEPRVHWALVCAAVGCPPLRPEAYTGRRLEEQLQGQARIVHAGERWFRFDTAEDVVHLTKLYDWYGGDFEQADGSVVAHAARHVPALREALAAGRSPRIRWLEYDWSLNARGQGR
jgi:hypothetical protein